MADNTNKSNDKAKDNLQGGTQGAPASSLIRPGGDPGGTNSLSPAGTARPAGRTPEPPTGDKAAAERQDPKRGLEGGRTKPSPDEVAQRARDAANVTGSTSGVDEGNPRQIPEDAPTPDGRTGND